MEQSPRDVTAATAWLETFLSRSRRRALASGLPLPERDTGTCLFADISGFTPLTESLGKSLGPQQGAEMLTSILNSIFERLISHVHDYGGDVFGFAGDAITCWFPTPPALPALALACAQAMQGEMSRFTAVPTPDGETHTLSMKVGLSHGPVQRFKVGASECGYFDVLTGATLDRMAAAEHHAQKGEIVCAPEIISMVSTANWGESREGFQPLCSLDVSSLVMPPPLEVPTFPLETLQPYFPPDLFRWLTGTRERFLAELRPVVSAFVRFEGLNYEHDPQVGEKLDQYVTAVQRIATQYGGNVMRLDYGDKGSVLHVIFGAPVTHEDDEARAIGWAFDVQAALKAPPLNALSILGQYIGMTKDQVYAGALGASMRRAYTLMGDAVNASARLMQACQPGQILVSQRIMQAAQKRFMFHQFPGFQVKGKYEAVPVATPLAPLPAMPQIMPVGTLVGRDQELAQLDEALNALMAGTGKVLRIEGGAGLGKSRLIAELVQKAMARGIRTLVGNGQSTGQSTPYLPWREILRSLFGLQSAWPAMQQAMQMQSMLQWINPEWLPRVPLLGDLLGLEIPDTPVTAGFDARLRQQSLFALVGDLLARMATQQPILFLIEDCHWIDEASTALIESLGVSLVNARVLLVVTHRPPDDPSRPLLPGLSALGHHVHINLAELTPEAVCMLVTTRLGGELPPEIMALIQERAQGNPFFVEELAETVRETSRLQMAGGRWMLTSDTKGVPRLPDTIQGVVLARLDRLDEGRKLTLKVACVAGRTFETRVLTAVHPDHIPVDELNSQLSTLKKRDFVQLELPVPHLTHRFKHNVTQEVIYATLLEAQRRDLHRAVADVLEALQPEEVDQLAYHYSQGGPEARQKALFYLDKAAHRAQQNYANEAALNYYRQALALEQRWQWLQGQIEVLHILGRREEEQAALQALQAMPEASPYETARLYGQYDESIGDYVQAQAAVERALTVARAEPDSIQEADCLSQLGLIARRQGDYEAAQNWYRQALVLFPDEANLSDKAIRVLVNAMNGLGIVHRQLSNFDESKACYLRALALSRARANRKGESDALNSLGVTAYYQRDFDEALGYYQQALEIRQAIGDRAGEGESLNSLAQIHVLIGQYDQAEECFSSALAIQQAIGNRWEQVNIWMGLGVMHLEMGNLSQARSCLQNGLKLTQEIGDEAGRAWTLINLGLVARDQGNLEEAEKLLVEGLALAQAQDDKNLAAAYISYLGTVCLLAHRLEEALSHSRAALDLRRELGLRLYTADDLAVLAVIHLNAGDLKQALDAARLSLEILDECGGEGPDYPHRDYFYCHQVLAAAGQTDQARTVLQSAYRIVMARAEKIADPALRKSFLENVPINRQIVQAMG